MKYIISIFLAMALVGCSSENPVESALNRCSYLKCPQSGLKLDEETKRCRAACFDQVLDAFGAHAQQASGVKDES